MHSLHSRLATTIIAGLLIGAACTSAATPAADLTPTASPSITITPATASPTATATPASPSPSVTPQPTPEPTPVLVPPMPTGVNFEEQVRVSDDEQVAEFTQTVTWGAPWSEGVVIRVYGVTECIAAPADPLPNTSGPCLVVHTPLPASVRALLATAPASAGVVSWAWTQHPWECDQPAVSYDFNGPAYHAVVLAAYGASGHSIFAIAAPGGWWTPAAGDIIC
ncbi:MAG: hypothetical protein AABZ33_09730 [Chloroflexota bacterium]